MNTKCLADARSVISHKHNSSLLVLFFWTRTRTAFVMASLLSKPQKRWEHVKYVQLAWRAQLVSVADCQLLMPSQQCTLCNTHALVHTTESTRRKHFTAAEINLKWGYSWRIAAQWCLGAVRLYSLWQNATIRLLALLYCYKLRQHAKARCCLLGLRGIEMIRFMAECRIRLNHDTRSGSVFLPCVVSVYRIGTQLLWGLFQTIIAGKAVFKLTFGCLTHLHCNVFPIVRCADVHCLTLSIINAVQ